MDYRLILKGTPTDLNIKESGGVEAAVATLILYLNVRAESREEAVKAAKKYAITEKFTFDGIDGEVHNLTEINVYTLPEFIASVMPICKFKAEVAFHMMCSEVGFANNRSMWQNTHGSDCPLRSASTEFFSEKKGIHITSEDTEGRMECVAMMIDYYEKEIKINRHFHFYDGKQDCKEIIYERKFPLNNQQEIDNAIREAANLLDAFVASAWRLKID